MSSFKSEKINFIYLDSFLGGLVFEGSDIDLFFEVELFVLLDVGVFLDDMLCFFDMVIGVGMLLGLVELFLVVWFKDLVLLWFSKW